MSFFASFNFYHLLPEAAAFVLMTMVTAMAGALALRYASSAIAAWRRRFTPELWRQYLRLGVGDGARLERIREATRLGRPAAEEVFL